jgi:hypothetical protein
MATVRAWIDAVAVPRGDPRAHVLRVPLTEAERERFRHAANRPELPLAVYARRALSEADELERADELRVEDDRRRQEARRRVGL